MTIVEKDEFRGDTMTGGAMVAHKDTARVCSNRIASDSDEIMGDSTGPVL